jgi:two-component system, cell cycle response regulator
LSISAKPANKWQLEDYSHSLEDKVRDRTQALEAEIDRRAAAEAALNLANQELHRIAYLDGLTQIPNRRRFDEQLQTELLRLKREQLPLSLILCDVDYFKRYNDFYGHQAGDYCLIQVAQAIAHAIKRPADLVARYGGEEFVILLPNTESTGAIEVAELIQQRIKTLALVHAESEVSTQVTLSLGITTLIPQTETTALSVLTEADQALYQAKQMGRNQYTIA